jgi:hypothetical protein
MHLILLHAEHVTSVQIPETMFLFDGMSPRSGLLRERATTPWFSMEEQSRFVPHLRAGTLHVTSP